MMRRALAGFVLALTVPVLAPVALVSTALEPLEDMANVLTGAAHADPVPAVAGGVYVSRVAPAPAGPAITVTLSNGRTDQLRPCRFEDGRRCYWQADRRGNGIGRDFLVMSGRVFYLDLAWVGVQ